MWDRFVFKLQNIPKFQNLPKLNSLVIELSFCTILVVPPPQTKTETEKQFVVVQEDVS